MSSWKQTAAAAIVTHEPPAATAPTHVGPSVADLRQAAKRFAEQAAAKPWSDFLAGKDATCLDLAAKLERYGSFASPKQAEFAVKLIGWSTPREAVSVARPFPFDVPAEQPHEFYGTPVPVAKPAPVQQPKTLCPNICATVNLNKFSRFTVVKLALSLKNDGSLIWVKWDGKIAGSINPATTEFRPSHRYIFSAAAHAECLAEIVRVEADPLGAAKENGVLTGRCSCCGRPLTDPTSIAIGIGPICLLQF